MSSSLRGVRVAAFASWMVMCVASPGLAEPVDDARAAVESTVDAVLSALKQPGSDSEQRKREIEQIAYERFDFVTMSRLVLARNWKKLDAAKQAEFAEEFKLHLSRIYGERIDRYDQEKVAIDGARLEPRGDVTVQTRIVGGQFDGIEIDYRMREKAADWRVIDVVIEGVSLVSNFRSQFKQVIAQQGADGLLQELKKKNAAPRAEAAS